LRVLPISDIHADKMSDGGLKLVMSLPLDVDVIIVAGDVGPLSCFPSFLALLCGRYENVIFVAGNHEYYGTPVDDVHAKLTELTKLYPNFHWLCRSTVCLGGTRFVGATLWFPYHPSNVQYEKPISYFGQVPSFREWTYEENSQSQRFFKEVLQPGDFVISHFLPSFRSVAPMFKKSRSNRFFVCPLDDVIKSKGVSYWVHGHTHHMCDYLIGTTRIVCNPVGYIEQDTGFSNELIIEV